MFTSYINILWCNCISVRLCIKPYFLRCTGNHSKGFTKGYLLWVIINNHIYKLNSSSNGDRNIPILAFDEAVYSTLEIFDNILNVFWGGIRYKKYLYSNNLETLNCIILLEIVLWGCLCLVLSISDPPPPKEAKVSGMWCISNEGAVI